MQYSDLWGDRPAAPPPQPEATEPAPPWFWDVEQRTGNTALRLRDGTLLLAVIQHGESWGIFQLQEHGDYWNLIQIRGDRNSALAEALAGARRAGLIE